MAVVEVRRAGYADFAPLSLFADIILRRDYFLRRGQLEEILLGRHHAAYVAELDGVLVGMAVVTAGTRLVNVLVHPAYRGLRIGAAMVEASQATEVRVKVDVAAGDPTGFYRRLGFRSTAERNAKGNVRVMRARRGRHGGRPGAIAPGETLGGQACQVADGKVRHAKKREQTLGGGQNKQPDRNVHHA